MAHQPFIGRSVEKKVVIKKLQATAEYPYLDKSDSCCYNVILIARTDSRSEDNHMEVNNFHTGISVVSLPPNTYLEVMPHPTLYKNGYTLLGPIIIDSSYKGELIIPLYKFRDVDCLDLPFPAVQFVVKENVRVFISADEIKKQTEDYASSYGSGGSSSTVIFQAESSGSNSNREPSYKGSSRGRGSNKKGNHMF